MTMKKLFDEIPFLENDKIILKRMEDADAPELERMTRSDRVYRYLPTFLYEQKYENKHDVIRLFYEECFPAKEGIFLGIYWKGEPSTGEDGMRYRDGSGGVFCGIAEFYGFRDPVHKISIGYRLLEEYWGRGIASMAVSLMVDYLYGQTEIEIITASTMIENQASAGVLRKNDFALVHSNVGEDWGYPEPTMVDKWIR